MRGKIDNGIYTAPDKSFAVKVPALSKPGGRIVDHTDADQVSVSFTDDFCRLFRVDRISRAALMKAGAPPGEQALLESVFARMVLPAFAQVSPEGKVVQQEFIAWKEGEALLVFTWIPKASICEVSHGNSTGQREPAIRAVCVFSEGPFVFVVHYQNDSGGKPPLSADEGRNQVEWLRKLLLEFADTIQVSRP
jgi:hypothetical protein